MKSMARLLSLRSPRFLLGGLVLALLGLACATSPTGRRQLTLFSERDMDRLGHQSFDQLKKDQEVSDDAEINAYVACVTKALTDGLAPSWQDGWEVDVEDDEFTAKLRAQLAGRQLVCQAGGGARARWGLLRRIRSGGLPIRRVIAPFSP